MVDLPAPRRPMSMMMRPSLSDDGSHCCTELHPLCRAPCAAYASFFAPAVDENARAAAVPRVAFCMSDYAFLRTGLSALNAAPDPGAAAFEECARHAAALLGGRAAARGPLRARARSAR